MQVKAGLGVQVESYKETSSNAVFGSGTREQREKVYQDAESEKTYFGRLSPGPCTYDAKVLCMSLGVIHLDQDLHVLPMPARLC